MSDRGRGAGQRDRPSEQDNPFAPPPEGTPDQPWRPRYPSGHGGGNPHDQGRDQDQGEGQGHGADGGEGEGENQRQRWGSQWSRRQPRRQPGGFGEPPGGGQGPEGRRNGGPGGRLGSGQRWDPSDPAQRHARYAVLAGMWGVFAGLLGWEWLGLLLGALALYWGISALRGGPRDNRDDARRSRRVDELEGREAGAPAPPRPAGAAGERPQFAAATAGVVLASASLLIVAASYTVQLVYKDYYDCVSDALTTPSREACEDLLPSHLRPLLGEQD